MAISTCATCDDVCAAMKKILQNRDNDFASIRKDPQEITGETNYTIYKSTLTLPTEPQPDCLVRTEKGQHSSVICTFPELKDRAKAISFYGDRVKQMLDAMPQGCTSWVVPAPPQVVGGWTFIGTDGDHPFADVKWMRIGLPNKYTYSIIIAFYASGFEIKSK
jgi:hypothetical protein